MYYDWFFTVFADGEIKEHKERFPVWKMGPLLRALGQKEVAPDKFEWDREGMRGLKLDAEIMMEIDYKDKSKSWPRMSNFRQLNQDEEGTPF